MHMLTKWLDFPFAELTTQREISIPLHAPHSCVTASMALSSLCSLIARTLAAARKVSLYLCACFFFVWYMLWYTCCLCESVSVCLFVCFCTVFCQRASTAIISLCLMIARSGGNAEEYLIDCLYDWFLTFKSVWYVQERCICAYAWMCYRTRANKNCANNIFDYADGVFDLMLHRRVNCSDGKGPMYLNDSDRMVFDDKSSLSTSLIYTQILNSILWLLLSKQYFLQCT